MQAQNYWICFRDKDTTDYLPEKFLSLETIAHRKKQQIPLWQYSDIPVNQSYVKKIEDFEVKIRHISRWFNAVSAEIPENQLIHLQTLSFIEKIIPLEGYFYPTHFESDFQSIHLSPALAQMDAQAFIEKSLDGKGINIGIIDAGFFHADQRENLKLLYDSNYVKEYRDFVSPKRKDLYKSQESSLDGHGTEVFSLIAGTHSDEKQKKGMATHANFYLARTDHGSKEYRGEEDHWLAAMEWMDSVGVQIINTSLGYSTGFDNEEENYKVHQIDGKTSIISKAVTKAVKEKGIFVVVSAGNEGNKLDWQILCTPADAKEALSVGAIQMTGMKASFSSIGTSQLPYLKPNVVAYSNSGTSYSAPLITGFAACLLQAKPSLLPDELKDIIEKSSELYPHGNYFVGYGVPQASAALKMIEGLDKDTVIEVINVDNHNKELRISYNDSSARMVIFHKANDYEVFYQELFNVVENEFVIKRPSQKVKKSTAWILGKKSWEIVW
ncbi:MAG: S8 family serine peptidase [Flammeovirgaceae bacterium]